MIGIEELHVKVRSPICLIYLLQRSKISFVRRLDCLPDDWQVKLNGTLINYDPFADYALVTDPVIE